MSNDNEKNITITREADKTIADMRNYVNKLREWFGDDSEVYRKAAESLMHCLAQMINLGGVIFKEGDLSLGGITDYDLHYGVIFSTSEVPDDLKEYEKMEGFPQIGTWSIHS